MYSSFYITYYPRDYNSNRQYILHHSTRFNSDDIKSWLKKEDVDYVLENTMNIPMNNYATLRYTLSGTSTLTNSSWNNIGYAYQYDTRPEFALDVGTMVTTFIAVDQRDPLSEILIRPIALQTNATKERKVSTTIAGLAQVGGVFSLVVSIQVLLFGFRLSLPWGVVHR
jgi:hypothetical protein